MWNQTIFLSMIIKKRKKTNCKLLGLMLASNLSFQTKIIKILPKKWLKDSRPKIQLDNNCLEFLRWPSFTVGFMPFQILPRLCSSYFAINQCDFKDVSSKAAELGPKTHVFCFKLKSSAALRKNKSSIRNENRIKLKSVNYLYQ